MHKRNTASESKDRIDFTNYYTEVVYNNKNIQNDISLLEDSDDPKLEKIYTNIVNATEDIEPTLLKMFMLGATYMQKPANVCKIDIDLIKEAIITSINECEILQDIESNVSIFEQQLKLQNSKLNDIENVTTVFKNISMDHLCDELIKKHSEKYLGRKVTQTMLKQIVYDIRHILTGK